MCSLGTHLYDTCVGSRKGEGKCLLSFMNASMDSSKRWWGVEGKSGAYVYVYEVFSLKGNVGAYN